jgi:hypothetical protein
MSKVAVAILLRGDDGGLCKDNFRVTRKLRCRESCSRDRLVIAALMADGTTKPVLTLIEAGDAIEAGILGASNALCGIDKQTKV